ncbi:MAG: YbjN domain-containing protein [Prochlorococcaceae cyanobacterium]|jgi:hypothetical protein
MRQLLADLVTRLARLRRPLRPVEEAVALVDEVLESLGVSGQREDSEDGFDWTFQVGSAPIEVALHPNPVLGELTLEVRSPMLRLPAGNLLALYRRCLELNRILVGCAIGVDQDLIVVAQERGLQGLDQSAFLEMLLNVASAADQFDDELAEEFGAIPLGQEAPAWAAAEVPPRMEPPLSAAPAMTSSTPPLPEADRDLLRILCCVAWSDGDFAAGEKRLLTRLVQNYFLPDGDVQTTAEAVEALAAEALQPDVLRELVPRLTSQEDRQLVLKLAYMLIRIDSRPGESSSINPQEKRVYRQLVELLELEEADVQEAEWAAEQELRQHSGLIGILASRFQWLGAWPSPELLEAPGMQWL